MTACVSEFTQLLFAGVTAAFITQALTWLRESRREKTKLEIDQRHIALQLAVALERFAIRCANQILLLEDELDEFYADPSRSRLSLTLPRLDLPNVDDWRWVDVALASEVFAAQPHIDLSQGTVDFFSERADPVQAAEKCQRELGTRGLECWRLACQIRNRYSIPLATFALEDWNFVESLRNNAGQDQKPAEQNNV